MNRYEEFLQRFAADAERLHRIGLDPIGYNPGYICSIAKGSRSIELPEQLVKDILSPLIRKAHPETSDDAEMIKAYKERTERRNS